MITQLEQRCVERLAEVFPETPRSLDAVRHRVEQLRGRPIRVIPSDPAGLRLPVGLWVHTPAAEIVWVDERTSKMHQLVIVGHELGHMLCDHEPTPFGASGSADAISRVVAARLSNVPTSAPDAILGRCGEDLDADDVGALLMEHEAEIVGRLLVRPFLTGHDRELAALFEGE